jgi:hypothetical protein
VSRRVNSSRASDDDAMLIDPLPTIPSAANGAREGQQAMTEYQAKLNAMREKTARLRTLRLARDAANQKTPPANRSGAA